MKALKFALFCFVLAVPSISNAQNHAFVELQMGTPDPETALTLDGGLSYGLPHDLAINTFFLLKSGWGEAYVGTSWAPLDWLKFGASIGVSQGEGQVNLRTAYMILLNYEQFSFLGITEMDHQAYTGDDASIWYDLNLMYQPLDWLIIGIKDRRPLGVGPMVRFKISPIELWVAWAPLAAEEVTFQPETAQFGLKLSF